MRKGSNFATFLQILVAIPVAGNGLALNLTWEANVDLVALRKFKGRLRLLLIFSLHEPQASPSLDLNPTSL